MQQEVLEEHLPYAPVLSQQLLLARGSLRDDPRIEAGGESNTLARCMRLSYARVDIQSTITKVRIEDYLHLVKIPDRESSGVLTQLREQSRWLMQLASDVTSQFGEDGIISAALDLLPGKNAWCIEFGAWDGRLCSNTCNLITSRGYRGVLIESDAKRFCDLQRTHGGGKNILLNASVGFSETDSLDALLPPEVPKDVDLLSIDIDGNDYHTWAAIKSFRPKLVIIEFNPTIATGVPFVQEKDERINQGSSAASLVDLGRAKGYELIAMTRINLLFVDSAYYPLFHIPDNSLEVMRADESDVPHIFVGFDGRVFLSEHGRLGSISLLWHGLTLRESAVQRLPRLLQAYPDCYSLTQQLLFRWFHLLDYSIIRYHLGTLRRRISSRLNLQTEAPNSRNGTSPRNQLKTAISKS